MDTSLASGEVGEFWRRELGNGLPAGWPGLDGKSGGSGQRLRTITAQVEMEMEPFCDKEANDIGDNKIKIIFYNMKCKDVLDKKFPVGGKNEIT